MINKIVAKLRRWKVEMDEQDRKRDLALSLMNRLSLIDFEHLASGKYHVHKNWRPKPKIQENPQEKEVIN